VEVRSIEGRGQRELLQVRTLSSGHPTVDVLAVHADAYSAEDRERELRWAASWFRQHASSPYRILAGDLNLDVDGDLFSSDPAADTRTYNDLCSDLDDAGLGKGPTAEPDRRLDYVLVSRGGWKVDSAGPWKGQRVGDMDHDPVVVDLLFD
jgi:endonuclease/exonuclease/phosphatase family metal-dependent hydrolase